MKNLFLFSAILTLCFSCKKANSDDPTVSGIQPIDVLKPSSGFTMVYDTATTLNGVTSASLGVYDFTLENETKLNLAFYSEQPSQQSNIRIPTRITKNFQTNQVSVVKPRPTPTYNLDPNTAYASRIDQFFPYSDVMINAGSRESGGFNGVNQLNFRGDISGDVATPNPIGKMDLCFRHPTSNSGSGFGYFATCGSFTKFNGESYTFYIGGIGNQLNLSYYLGGCFHETYLGNGIREFFAIGVAADSVKVFKIDYTNFGSATTQPTYTQKLIQAIPTKITANVGNTMRHYTVDGKKLSFWVVENGSNLYSTYSYDFTTNTLKQHLKQVSLEYKAAQSDIDLDENGNIYYSGIAGNGTNTTGVSIYKKSSAALPSLVGSDNFLKYGTIVKLKYLFGKVYIAVTGKQTGKTVYQLSILKQQ